jgi:RIO kinase 2
VETGSKNHEVVPTPLIAQISSLRGSSAVHRSISNLAKVNLIARVKNARCEFPCLSSRSLVGNVFLQDDGYRLTYGGLDYLALHTHLKRHTLYSSGSQIGTGKESDIHAVASPSGVQYALKIHRLGRISFRSVKTNRDYLRHRSAASWLYMSRLAAIKEYAFLTALRAHGFPVPEPIAQSRHTLVMELVQALPLRQVGEVLDPAGLYAELLELILRLVDYGLIHGDFNEFNILIREDEVSSPPSSTLPDSSAPPATQKTQTPILIDFPQMVSIDHANAEMYFARDVACIKRFFVRRFHFTSDEPGPFFADACARARRQKRPRLDVEVEASGFSRKMARELDKYMRDVGGDEVGDTDAEDSGIAEGSDHGDNPGETNQPGEDDGLAYQSEDIPAIDRDTVVAESSGYIAPESDMDAGFPAHRPLDPDVSSLVHHLSGASL